MNYTFAGNTFPKKADYDTVCRLCARVGVQDDGDSSATVSSLSSSRGSLEQEVCRRQNNSTYDCSRAAIRSRPRLDARAGPRPAVALRLRESESFVIFLLGFSSVSLFLGFLLLPGWRFPVSLRRVCVGVLVWVRVCVFVFRAWAFVVPSAFLRCLCCCGGPLWRRAVGVCWLASCPGRFSSPVSWVFFSGISQDTWGVGRVRDSSASASEVVKAESSANLSCEG